MFGSQTVKERMRVDLAISAPMAEALQLWAQMYENKAPWLNDYVKSLNLPAAIAGEIARAATIEMKAEFTGSARAKYLEQQFGAVMKKLRSQVAKGAAKGGVVMKPYVDGKKIAVDFVQADMFYPVAFDGSGEMTACIFADQRTISDKFYTRLEYHRMVEGGCAVTNRAFRSDNREALGVEVPLASVPEWESIVPEALIRDIDRPLFAYFKYPADNFIDATSPLGVSCYAGAVDLIQEADIRWSDLSHEFWSGRRAVFVDELAFGKDANNKPKLPDNRLYRTLDTGETESSFFEAWSPEFRNEAIESGLDTILKRIEFNCGLAYGTLSDPQTVEKTATEIAAGKQRTYATVTDTQKALQGALESLLWAMDVWATLASLAPSGTYEVAFSFDDSLIVDYEKQFMQDMQLVASGIMGKVEFRMRNFKEPEEVARKKVAEAQGERETEASMFGDVP